jgi:hypothetical protein
MEDEKMIKSSTFSSLVPFRGGSVPSIGGTPSMASALAAFERAEAQLEAARAQARAAARREGRSVSGLFGESNFIRRSTGERWADTARNEGWSAGHRFLSDALSRSVSTEALDEKSPFRHLAKRLKQPGAMERQRAVAAKLEATGFQDALDARDYDEAARILVQVRREEETGHVTGAAILKAAKDRRMGGPPVPEPPQGSFAQRVAAAAKKARGED